MEDNIVFFDGVCGLCNQTVDWLIRKDKKNKLIFSPLQGNLAKKYIGNSQLNELNTIIYFHKGKKYTKSTAVLKIMSTLGGVWSIVSILFVFPLFIRDCVYELVSKNRYVWFGKKETCRIPSPEERAKFRT